MTHQEERVEVTIAGIESCVVYAVSARCASDGSPWSSWSPKQTVTSMLNRKGTAAYRLLTACPKASYDAYRCLVSKL